MKRFRTFFKVIFPALILVSLSILSFFENIGSFIFANGSTSSLIEIATCSWQLKIGFAILSLFLWTVFLKLKKKQFLLLFLFLLVIWISTGRTIGYISFPDGKIVTGWFYIGTNDFNLCDHSIDCETQTDYKTTIKKLAFWRVQIKNDLVDKTIFIGPMAWNQTVEMLEAEIGAGTYTK